MYVCMYVLDVFVNVFARLTRSTRTVVAADEIVFLLDEAGVPPCISLREQARFRKFTRALVDPCESSPVHVSRA